MSRSVLGFFLTCLALIASACDRSANQTEVELDSIPATPAGSTAASSGSIADGSAADEHATAGHAAAGEGGQALLPIMRTLGSEMTALTYALMTDDFETVERSAGAIAEHAPISAEEIERIHAVLGPDMARFEAVDESVHVASVRLHEAAQARQSDQIVEQLAEVQSGCVSCHAQFRERLRSDGAAP